MHGRTPTTMSSIFRRHSPQASTTISNAESGKEKVMPQVDKETGSGGFGKSKGTQEDKEEELRSSRRSSRLYSLFGIPSSILSRSKSLQDVSIPSVATESRRRFVRTLKTPTEAPLPSAIARKGPEGIITLLISPEHVPYYVHKDFLIHHSGYFKKALVGPWKESEERVVILDDVEIAPFNILVHFLYTSQIPSSTDEWVKISQAKKWKIEVVELKLLVLADRFHMSELLQLVNNDLVGSRMKHAPYYELVIYAWENLPEGSPILRLLVDTHVANWEPKTDEGDEEEMELRPELPHEFLIKAMIRFAEVGTERDKDKNGKAKKLVACDYHLHADDEEKEKCSGAS
jgi:hypothetical protein